MTLSILIPAFLAWLVALVILVRRLLRAVRRVRERRLVRAGVSYQAGRGYVRE